MLRRGCRQQYGRECGIGRTYGTRGVHPGPAGTVCAGRARLDDADLGDHLMVGKGVERPGPVDVTTPFRHGRTVVPLLLNARVTPAGSTPRRSAVLLLAGSHPIFLCRHMKSRDLGNGEGGSHCPAGEPSVVPTSASVKIGGMHGVTGAFARVSLSRTASSSTMGT